jgi:hypothetical protein
MKCASNSNRLYRILVRLLDGVERQILVNFQSHQEVRSTRRDWQEAQVAQVLNSYLTEKSPCPGS